MPNGKSEKLTRNFLLDEEALFVLWIVLFHGCNGTRSNGRIEHIPQRGRLIGRSQLKRATRSSNGAQYHLVAASQAEEGEPSRGSESKRARQEGKRM